MPIGHYWLHPNKKEVDGGGGGTSECQTSRFSYGTTISSSASVEEGPGGLGGPSCGQGGLDSEDAGAERDVAAASSSSGSTLLSGSAFNALTLTALVPHHRGASVEGQLKNVHIKIHVESNMKLCVHAVALYHGKTTARSNNDWRHRHVELARQFMKEMLLEIHTQIDDAWGCATPASPVWRRHLVGAPPSDMALDLSHGRDATAPPSPSPSARSLHATPSLARASPPALEAGGGDKA